MVFLIAQRERGDIFVRAEGPRHFDSAQPACMLSSAEELVFFTLPRKLVFLIAQKGLVFFIAQKELVLLNSAVSIVQSQLVCLKVQRS